jgi:NTE family protein
LFLPGDGRIIGTGRLIVVFEGLFSRHRNGDRTVNASAAAERPTLERPSIGLALGGGAARGFAHIGVMRVLAENGIVPDVIVGTSIGAVVGGTYAANELDEMEAWARKLTFRGILGQLDISLSGAGLISGRKLDAQLKAALNDRKIEDLPIRFAAIATEFTTGHEIWLTHGRIVDALRASYALPGIFPPVRIAGRWLVDGALVNPVPVSAARALGARLVIAVGLNSDLFGRGTVIADYGTNDTDDGIPPPSENSGLRGIFHDGFSLRHLFGGRQRPGIPTVMIEAFNVMQDRITRARLAGDPPDVSIMPKVGSVGWFDFHRATESIELGAEAAEKALPSIEEAIAALSHPVEANGASAK